MYSIAFSPDGRHIAVGGMYGSGLLIDARRLDLVATWEHPNVDPSIVEPDSYGTNCVGFGEGGAVLATGHADGSIVIWELPGFRE